MILYDDGDFEVVATLEFRYDDFFKRDVLLGIPDWSTFVRLYEETGTEDKS